jgi:glutamate synthase (NADPH/NADH) large chain
VAAAARQDAPDRPGQGRIVSDDEIKRELATANPYRDWLDRTQIVLEDLPVRQPARPPARRLLDRQQAFGYTQEDIKFLLTPMATDRPGGHRLHGHRHADLGAVDKSKLLYTYFKQNFAQVTNPPIDPIREELVMSLVSFIGPRPNSSTWKACRRQSGWKCASRS